jgi:hypothetical protein
MVARWCQGRLKTVPGSPVEKVGHFGMSYEEGDDLQYEVIWSANEDATGVHEVLWSANGWWPDKRRKRAVAPRGGRLVVGA